MKKLIPAIVLLAAPQLVFAAAPSLSFFPRDGLGELLATRFDLSTIRSSIGPRRGPGANTFAALGMRSSSAGDTRVVFDTGNWRYEITVLRRGDFNRDGLEDLEVCFIDRAAPAHATYNAQQALLVTRYTADGNLVALAYAMDGCESFGR